DQGEPDRAHHDGQPAGTAAARRAYPARPGDGGAQGDRPGAGSALPDGGGDDGGPAALPQRPADPGAAGGDLGAPQQVSQARPAAEKSRDAAVAQAYRALLNETRGLRLTRHPGWRGKALENVQSLAKMNTPRRDLAELRAEAVAALLETDARQTLELKGHDSF